MTIRAWFVVIILLAGVNSCGPDVCPKQMQLDYLLEGGYPVCLGGSADQIYAYPNHSTDDSYHGLALYTDGADYSYDRQGGIDLIVAHPFSHLGRGCVTPRERSTVVGLAERIKTKLGGEWTRVESPPEVSRWQSSEGLVVGFRDPADRLGGSLCVSTRLP